VARRYDKAFADKNTRSDLAPTVGNLPNAPPRPRTGVDRNTVILTEDPVWLDETTMHPSQQSLPLGCGRRRVRDVGPGGAKIVDVQRWRNLTADFLSWNPFLRLTRLTVNNDCSSAGVNAPKVALFSAPCQSLGVGTNLST
jgi:hypothetical protein